MASDLDRHHLEDLWARVREQNELPAFGGFRSAPLEGFSWEHGNILVGDDRDGLRHVLIPVPEDENRILEKSTRGVQIRVVELESESANSPDYYLDVGCRVEGLAGLFASLCADILREVIRAPADAISVCIKVFERWRELLARESSGHLSIGELAALLGELLVLERIARLTPDSLGGWAGPDGGRHDFVSGSCDLEVKTSLRSGGRTATISSIDQLEIDPPADLFLTFISLRSTPGRGENVPAVIQRILGLGVDQHILYRKLAACSYIAADEDHYRPAGFEVREFLVYEVGADFPRLSSSSFKEGEPVREIGKITYEVDLSGDSPEPMGDAEAVFKRFSGIE